MIDGEEKLFLRYRETGDLEVRNQIVERFYYLAEALSKKFRNRGVDYEDLVQVGSLALIKAVERFDPGKNIKFITFATPTIIGEIKKYFRDKSSGIRMPRKYYEAYPQIKSAMDALTQEKGAFPTPNEIAEAVGLRPEEVLEIIEMSKGGGMLSLDEEYDEDGITRSDTYGQVEEGFENVENRQLFQMALDLLTDEEKQIIRMRHENQFTQKSIADAMGYSQMYISRLEKRIYKKLKGMIRTE